MSCAWISANNSHSHPRSSRPCCRKFLRRSRRRLVARDGPGSGCVSLGECWKALKEQFLKLPEGERKPQLLAGFLKSAMDRSAAETEDLLDAVVEDPRMHQYFLYWQASVGINGNAFDRIMEAVGKETVPVQTFLQLSLGRSHEGLADQQLRAVVQGLMVREGGSSVVGQILGMRVHGRKSDSASISETLRATCREMLATVELKKGIQLDYLVGRVIQVAYAIPGHDDEARALCARIVTAIQTGMVNSPTLDQTVERLRGQFREWFSMCWSSTGSAKSVQGAWCFALPEALAIP